MTKNTKLALGIGLIAVVGIAGFIGYSKNQRKAISQFTLTAPEGDAAGVPSSAHFELKSTEDLSGNVIATYLHTNPEIAVAIDKKGTGTYTITPKEKLPENKVLAIRIDQGPIAAQTYGWAFQVKAPFQVISKIPADKASSVPTNSAIEITLNRDQILNPEAFITVTPAVRGQVSVHDNVVTFLPATNALAPKTIYTVTVKKGIKAAESNDTLADDVTWKFETGQSDSYVEQPQLNFDQTFQEFAPGHIPTFEVYANQLGQTATFPASVYRFNTVEEFLQAYKVSHPAQDAWAYYNGERPYDAPVSSRILSTTLHVENQMDVRSVSLPKVLDQGFYLLDTTVAPAERQQVWFQVTDLVNYIAVSNTKSVVWLRSLAANGPVVGAAIKYDDQDLSTRTDSNGVAQVSTPEELIVNPSSPQSWQSHPQHFFVASSGNQKVAIPIQTRYGSAQVQGPDSWWSYLSFDKTVYLPSDTMHFWGIVKSRNGSDIRGQQVTIELTPPIFGTYDPTTTVYAATQATISDFNTVTGALAFSGVKPGYYQLSIKLGNTIILSQGVNIDAYLKPAYTLSVTTDKVAIFAGDAIAVKVKAHFFEGTPVANLKVDINTTLQDTALRTITLDRNGEGSLVIPTKYNDASYWPNYLTIDASPAVAEEGDIGSSASVLVFGPAETLAIDQSLSSQTSSFTLKLHKVVLDNIKEGAPYWESDVYSGGPVANAPISVNVVKIVQTKTQTGQGYDAINKVSYPIYEYTSHEEPVKTDVVVTDASGQAHYNLPLEKDQSYHITFTRTDTGQRTVRQERYAYQYSGSYFDDYDASGIILVNPSAQAAYAINDTISLRTQTIGGQEVKPGQGTFLFYWMHAGIEKYAVQNDGNFRDTFKESYLPNENIGAVWFSGTRFHETPLYNLPVDPTQRGLSITVHQDKDRYKPGDTVGLSVEVRDPTGKPKSAEVNISALDAAAFALNPQETDITSMLYRGLSPTLLTRSSHLIPVGSVQTGGGGAERGGCFLPGTKILTTNGQINIEDIRAGTKILTRQDETSTTLTEAEVVRTTSHLVHGYYTINGMLNISENHRIYVNGAWQRAGSVAVGDTLEKTDGTSVAVTSVVFHDEWRWVYNFEVADQHTYIANGLYVHNEEKGGGAPRSDFKDVAYFQNVTTGSDGTAKASFKLPDNLTSWRLAVQGVSNDLFAGKAIAFVPVGLPFFADATINRTYLAGDTPILRVRVFGTAAIPDRVHYKITSDTLPFKTSEQDGGATTEFSLGAMPVGNHKITIEATSGNLHDSLVRDVTVLPSYFKDVTASYYDVTPALSSIKGNTNGYTDLVVTSQERGKVYPYFGSLLYSQGVRIDEVASRYLSCKLLQKYYKDQCSALAPSLAGYQRGDGGISLLPYSDTDLTMSALFVDAFGDEQTDISRESLKTYFTNTLHNETADLSRESIALYGLAALHEPVLNQIRQLGANSSLTTTDRAYLVLALNAIGAKEEARASYARYLKSGFPKQDSESDRVLTALAMSAAGSLQEPEADALAVSVAAHPPKTTLNNFQWLTYLRNVLPSLGDQDISFSYTLGSQKGSVKLQNGEAFTISIPTSALNAIHFDNMTGHIGLISRYEEATTPDDIKKDSAISISRVYTVDGRATTTFHEGELVKVILTPRFGPSADNWYYEITDHLPSGLRPSTKIFNEFAGGYQQCIGYPVYIEDQTVTLLSWNPPSPQCPSLFYYARVVNKGGFTAEPVLLQSPTELSSQTISPATHVEIK